MKFYSSLAMSLVLASSILSPVAHAQSSALQKQIEQKKEEVISELHQHPHKNSFNASSSTSTAVSSEADYKHEINVYETHQYVFVTDGGAFSVNNLHPESQTTDFLIYNLETGEIVNSSDNNSFELSAGTYGFVVFSISGQPEDYEFILDGPFIQEPDTSMPYVDVNGLEKHETILSKYTNPLYKIKGYTDANHLTFFNSANSSEPVLDQQGMFQAELNLQKGENPFSFYAEMDSGNAIESYYSLFLSGLTRIGGKDRYEVSSNVSKELTARGANTSGTVIIAKGDVYADALTGGPLASAEGSPILLTETQSLPPSVRQQIMELGAKRAIILGGTGSVNMTVESELKSLGVTTILRYGGSDRYAVSAKTAERVSQLQGSDTAIIASGEVFPDALSASTIAGPLGMPILLVNSGSIPGDIKAFLQNNPEIKKFIVVGGPGTVKDTVISQLKSITAGAAVDRIGGMDRYEVSINTAEYGMQNYGMDLKTVAFARADLYPDAISGAPLANLTWSPILLTRTDALESKVEAFLDKHAWEMLHAYIWGGTGSISTYQEQQLDSRIQ